MQVYVYTLFRNYKLYYYHLNYISNYSNRQQSTKYIFFWYSYSGSIAIQAKPSEETDNSLEINLNFSIANVCPNNKKTINTAFFLLEMYKNYTNRLHKILKSNTI